MREYLSGVPGDLAAAVQRILDREPFTYLETHADPCVERMVSRILAGVIGLNAESCELPFGESALTRPRPTGRRVDAHDRRSQGHDSLDDLVDREAALGSSERALGVQGDEIESLAGLCDVDADRRRGAGAVLDAERVRHGGAGASRVAGVPGAQYTTTDLTSCGWGVGTGAGGGVSTVRAHRHVSLDRGDPHNRDFEPPGDLRARKAALEERQNLVSFPIAEGRVRVVTPLVLTLARSLRSASRSL
jgi:hypothetical protein